MSCGGTNFLRQGNTEIHFTNYNLRNLSDSTPIRIDRIVVYAATGAVLFRGGRIMARRGKQTGNNNPAQEERSGYARALVSRAFPVFHQPRR